MITTVYGGSGSGKSAFAENLAVKIGGQKIYIATMQPFDDEAYKRIENHRKMRQNKGFETVEKYNALYELEFNKNVTVLLDCISNLVANEMFTPKPSSDVSNEIIYGIDSICKQCDNVVFVTNDIFCDGLQYDNTTMEYMSLLGQVNKYLAKISDNLVEVVCGIAIYHKGC